jgi:hypothetical protein
MRNLSRLGVRWTIGDVSLSGFEALQASIWGAYRVFGPSASYAVCVNSVPLATAQRRAGTVPAEVVWRAVDTEVPGFLRERFDAAMAEGVGWKFAPLQLFPDRFELALDNDCILWEVPNAIRLWLDGDDPDLCVVAEDVRPCFGIFAPFCGPAPRNSGIRGLPPGFDLRGALSSMLDRVPGILSSELDEQGLQIAAVSQGKPPLVVSVDEISICSPFPPHLPNLGRCGAHFVGLNAKRFSWSYEGVPAEQHVRAHWHRHREEVRRRVGVPDGPRLETTLVGAEE